jgi:NAD-dependent dihydropyrimidine dehydrogenase PreA subunit
MAKDLSQTKWHGVPRQDIPWFPQVNPEACIGCELCFVTCGREVYEIELQADGKHRKAVAKRPYNCMVGCSTCSMVCPTQAITFPGRDVVWEIEKQFKIFGTVRKEAAAKREKAGQPPPPSPVSAPAESAAVTRMPVRIAGLFGEKRLLVKLQEFIADRPYDIEDLQLSVPTLKGLHQGAPAYMSFQIASTEQADVAAFVEELKALVAANDLVWVDEQGKLSQTAT